MAVVLQVPGTLAPAHIPPEELVVASSDLMQRRERTAFGLGIFVYGLVILSQFLAVWPAVIGATAEGAGDQRITLMFGLAHVTVTPEVAVLAGVMLAGMLGALGYMTRQFIVHTLQGDLTKRAEWWYILLPIQAGALAAIVYFTLQGGLLSADQSNALNPYGVVAIAALVGLFARHAMNALSRVFEQIFGTPDDKKVLAIDDKNAGSSE